VLEEEGDGVLVVAAVVAVFPLVDSVVVNAMVAGHSRQWR
jgi:hypothetical protein